MPELIHIVTEAAARCCGMAHYVEHNTNGDDAPKLRAARGLTSTKYGKSEWASMTIQQL
jgi:hypothetical protein